jgi:U3 small nucleolar RNA-associated protein 20
MVAASLSSRAKPVRFLKKGTETTKSHRFEPFSQRIAKLKIDPIHRVRRTSFGEEDGDGTSSHFRASLDHWDDMNLSENFSDFSRRVGPLSESLPQILYHEEKIMALLVEYIEKKDQLSMEPLLSLLAQFARDLGVRFEKHFATSVSLVASVAASHPEVEVVEWCFTCLAWIFKFLSRLLVPDLRQLLSIMTPYLGKERQKPFIARFAAESMSFLIRKAGLVYYKNKGALDRAVSFLLEDLRSCGDVRNAEIYKEGLMAMFSDAIKGVKGGIHSNGSDILSCLIHHAVLGDDQQSILAEQVLRGVITNVMHNTSAETFGELLGLIRTYAETEHTQNPERHARLSCHLILICVATRKGSRVKNWKEVHQSLLALLKRALIALESFQSSMPQLLTAVAYTLQHSPMDEMLPFMRPLMECVVDERLSAYFLSFCATFADFGSERFHIVVLPYFQRFLASFYDKKEEELCLRLLKLEESGCVTSQASRAGFVSCPANWKMHISRKFSKPGSSPEEVALLNAYARLPGAVSLSTDGSILPEMVQSLHGLLSASLRESSSDTQALNTFACGQGFKSYVDLSVQCGNLDSTLWDLIVTAGPRYARLRLFLQGALGYVMASREVLAQSTADIEPFANALIDNLTSPSHELRSLSLRLLLELTGSTTKDDPAPISIAIEIEESELTLQTARFLSMQVRKLALMYPQVASHKWFGRLIPRFCFGLFSKKLGQLWDDSAEALKTISQHATGEKIVTELATSWLQDSGSSVLDDEPSDEATRPQVSPEFACFNVANVENRLAAHFEGPEDSREMLRKNFDHDHISSDLLPLSPRSYALRVLHAVPWIAEKRSRQIVPLFLSWASHEGDSGNTPESGSKSPMALTPDEAVPWGYKDRISLLGLFQKFINPGVLYKASEVHEALLSLLTNGDSEVQKSALKALFTWKSPNIVPYQENLLNILDESRFRDELAVFVRVGREDSTIEEGHKGELLSVLLRLLYGRMVSRAASHSASGGQAGRRKAILRNLSHLSESDFELFVQIAFGSLWELGLVENGQVNMQCFDQELINLRRQSGLLKMIETMFDTLKSRMLAYSTRSMNVVVYCLVRACRLLAEETKTASTEARAANQSTLVRDIRQQSIRCLDLIFSVTPDMDWTSYIPILFDEVINPRLGNFAIETAQGISGLHRLFHTWASSPRSVFYLSRHNHNLVPTIVDSLNVESARDEVKIFVMDQILQPILGLSTGSSALESDEMIDCSADEIRAELIAPYVDHILSHLSQLLQKSNSKLVMISGVETVSSLAPCVESSKETSGLIKIATYLLRQPPDRVAPKTKAGLLRILQHFLPLYSVQDDLSLTEDVFRTVSSLFDYFKDQENRTVLATVLAEFAKRDQELLDVSALCADLNAVSSQKLDEVDYGRRLQAFTKINEDLWASLNAKQWRPLLFNMLFHVKDEEELAVRSSASFGLKRFMERAVQAEDKAGFQDLIDNVVMPALQTGVRQRSEMVRIEFVSALGHLVKLNPTMPSVQDMHVLLVDGDEEASFFYNILHIQQHRRFRALRRLAAEAAKGIIQASNISSIFMPLIEVFILNIGEDESSHNLAAESVATIGALAEWLQWSQFRSTFRRYRAYMQSKPELERNIIRLLGRMTDALSNAIQQKDPEQDVNDIEMNGVEPGLPTKCRLAASLPPPSKISAELTTHFIPFLTNFVHHKEESQMSLRLPVAVTTIKMLKLLSEEDMAIRLPSVLLDVCTVLRSKAQESRDVARKSLADIAIILGPSYFGYILNELRTALARGYQLHVLSFTVHSILVATTDEFKQGDLDHCLRDVVSVVMDDIFGATGQEKDAEGYVSSMKEIKSNKSYDSMELLAKNSSVTRLGTLIAPLQLLLREKLTSNLVKKIDELLRRIGVGLLRNPEAESRDLLVFCYEVIKESYEDRSTDTKVKQPYRNRRFLVNLQGAKRGEKRGTTSSYVYKLSRFGLDVLRSTLNKFHSLLTPTNVAGFLPIIGDAVVQAHEEVKISAMRLLSTIVKLPLPEIDKNCTVYLTEAVKVIKEAPTTNTEAAQAALKLIAATLRERKSTELRDGQLAYLLKRLSADIEEPDRQGVTFNFIRAVMERKFLVAEMYELVDNIAVMMVTNQTRAARDLARGAYIHFLLEYPQAKSRWSKQLGFLAKNFDYQHREGRESVMEAVHMLLSKTDGDLAQEIIGTFFLPLVLIMANDETTECRQMAGVLMGEFFARADREQRQVMLKPLHSWLEQTEKVQLVSTGLQAMRIFFEVDGTEKEKEARFVIEILPHLIDPIFADRESEHWEVLYFALQLLMKVCKTVPSVGLSKDCAAVWSSIREALFYPHAWVKTCAANLIGSWLSDLAKTNASSGYGSVPLVSQHGLGLDEEAMLQLTRASIQCLRTPRVTEELAMQSVRNTIFLVRCLAENGVTFSKMDEESADDVTSDESDADEEALDETTNGTRPSRNSPIHYIFLQISNILRRETLTTKAESLVPKTASMGLLAAICRHLKPEQIMPSLPVILLPLQHLIDPSIPAPRSSEESFRTAYKSLVGNGQEVLDLLQKKLGTTEYVAQMARIQGEVKARREERRVKRRIEAVTDPEKFGREKVRKNELKKVKRKEKGMEHRGRRRGW